MQATLEPATNAKFTARDKKMMSNVPYAQATIPEPYQRHIVDYHRAEAPGSIVVDTDARYLYYVLENRKAIRYGVTVGEDALRFWGTARVGRKEEWPRWIPTADIKRRFPNLPDSVDGGAHNPLGARGIYLFQGSRDTLFRIHGTNQPEYIGQAISSGCIRMTNEDVIDLYDRVRMGAIVVVLAPSQGDSPLNPRVAAMGKNDPTRE
jgi:lipoprotein-anchoring transpeptidase ErfK/SrfK